MGSGNVKHQAAVATTADLIDQLRTDILKQLAVLRDLTEQLEDLADTRQSVGLGFMTDDARTARDKQVKADREAARGLVGRDERPGLVWMNTTTVLGTGQVPAPVTVTAVSAATEILFALQHQLRRLARPAAIAAAAAVPGSKGRLPLGLPITDTGIAGLTRQLADLVEIYTSRRGLEALLRDLDHLEAVAREVIDGPARTSHPDACPWCGRHTLAVYHREAGRDQMFIRCDGKHPCTCDDEWCPCHRNPVKHRHEWVNTGRAKNPVDGRSRHSLTTLITRRKELTVLETRALDALERIRALHQPHWTGPDGEQHTWFVYTDEPPADHVCIDLGPDRCDLEEGYHSVLACIECRRVTDHGEVGNLLWPCPTYQACDLDHAVDDSPVAGVSDNHQE